MTTHYLLDVSWLLYRGFFAFSKIYSEYPELHFLSKKIESILLSNKENIIYMCLDGGAPKGRRLLGESYKANRHQNSNYNVYAGLPSFVKLLNSSRIKVYYNNNYESDEIIFTLSKLLDGRKKILSGDKDLLQSLDSSTIIDNGSKFIITEASYKLEYCDQFFSIDPIRLPVFRAIIGDASDTLFPPVKRFPRKLAAKIVESLDYDGNRPTVEQLKNVAVDFSDSEKKWVSKLIEAYKPFSINFDIMKLNVITDDLTHNKYNYAEVELSDFLKSKIERLNTL